MKKMIFFIFMLFTHAVNAFDYNHEAMAQARQENLSRTSPQQKESIARNQCDKFVKYYSYIQSAYKQAFIGQLSFASASEKVANIKLIAASDLADINSPFSSKVIDEIDEMIYQDVFNKHPDITPAVSFSACHSFMMTTLNDWAKPILKNQKIDYSKQ